MLFGTKVQQTVNNEVFFGLLNFLGFKDESVRLQQADADFSRSVSQQYGKSPVIRYDCSYSVKPMAQGLNFKVEYMRIVVNPDGKEVKSDLFKKETNLLFK